MILAKLAISSTLSVLYPSSPPTAPFPRPTRLWQLEHERVKIA